MTRVKSLLVFALHQFIGTWGVAFLAAAGVFEFFNLLVTISPWETHVRSAYRLLTENPFYPVQIVTGLYFGWLLGRRLKHRCMLWIWVLPLAALCYALTVGLILIPEWTSVLARPRTVGSRFSHYFGWGCQPRAHCLDQLLITMPFYASASYSLGALLARKALKKAGQVLPVQ